MEFAMIIDQKAIVNHSTGKFALFMHIKKLLPYFILTFFESISE
jgi:hypothetical protein